MPSAFVDTNILLYAASNHPSEREKSRRARQLLLSEDVAFSVQVLQEFYANAIHPRKLGFARSQAVAFCEVWMEYPVASLTVDTFIRGLQLSARFGLSNWDATIIAAARELGCSTLYSEDFNDGRDYEGVLVVNPFTVPPSGPAGG
jgi:predicted nucleic acid-binding protein